MSDEIQEIITGMALEKRWKFYLAMIAWFLFLMIYMTSCTLSFTNVMTHGTATDVVDSTPTQETKVDADVDVPIMKTNVPSPSVQALPS